MDLQNINIVQLISFLAGPVAIIINLWIANKLSPITNNVTLLKQRLEWLEGESKRREPLMDRMTRVEEQSKENGKKLDAIEGKMDRLLDQK
jgi:hypothetical protein